MRTEFARRAALGTGDVLHDDDPAAAGVEEEVTSR
jgi:hypothetical protein